MQRITTIVGITCMLGASFFLTTTHGQEGHQHQEAVETPHHAQHGEVTSDATQTLSPKLRGLLRKEMISLDLAMGTLGSDITQGRWGAAANTAKRIQDSFILKQALTKEQKHELHTKLPEAFLEQDRRFHAQAGKMAEAARHKDRELGTFYYYRMMSSCVDCHSTHAPNRFPGLRRKESVGHEH